MTGPGTADIRGVRRGTVGNFVDQRHCAAFVFNHVLALSLQVGTTGHA